MNAGQSEYFSKHECYNCNLYAEQIPLTFLPCLVCTVGIESLYQQPHILVQLKWKKHWDSSIGIGKSDQYVGHLWGSINYAY